MRRGFGEVGFIGRVPQGEQRLANPEKLPPSPESTVGREKPRPNAGVGRLNKIVQECLHYPDSDAAQQWCLLCLRRVKNRFESWLDRARNVSPTDMIIVEEVRKYLIRLGILKGIETPDQPMHIPLVKAIKTELEAKGEEVAGLFTSAGGEMLDRVYNNPKTPPVLKRAVKEFLAGLAAIIAAGVDVAIPASLVPFVGSTFEALSDAVSAKAIALAYEKITGEKLVQPRHHIIAGAANVAVPGASEVLNPIMIAYIELKLRNTADTIKDGATNFGPLLNSIVKYVKEMRNTLTTQSPQTAPAIA